MRDVIDGWDAYEALAFDAEGLPLKLGRGKRGEDVHDERCHVVL